LVDRILNVLFWRGIRRTGRVVVVAEYWKRFLQENGVSRISVIRNSFSREDYMVSTYDTACLRRRFAGEGVPLVYLGIADPIKGSWAAAEALRSEPYRLVVSGEGTPPPGALHVRPSHGDFPVFLAAMDVTVTIPSFEEGWSRVAHESLLAGTPVVGTDTGGLGELLRLSAQPTIARRCELPEAVAFASRHQRELVAIGRQALEPFDHAYFSDSWAGVVQRALQQRER
jgi:glycosyltransferase involved in cell wall biosynthesis